MLTDSFRRRASISFINQPDRVTTKLGFVTKLVNSIYLLCLTVPFALLFITESFNSSVKNDDSLAFSLPVYLLYGINIELERNK